MSYTRVTHTLHLYFTLTKFCTVFDHIVIRKDHKRLLVLLLNGLQNLNVINLSILERLS